MVGHDHLEAEQAGEGYHDGGAYGVYVQDVGAESSGFDDGAEGVDDGFEALAVRGRDVYEPDAVPLCESASLGDGVGVVAATDDGDVEALAGQQRIELFADGLDAALDARYAAGAGHHDFHFPAFSWSDGMRRSPWRGSCPHG